MALLAPAELAQQDQLVLLAMPQRLPGLRGQRAILGLLAPPEMRLLLLGLQGRPEIPARPAPRATLGRPAPLAIQVQPGLPGRLLLLMVLLVRQVTLARLVRPGCLVRPETLVLLAPLGILAQLAQQACLARQEI